MKERAHNTPWMDFFRDPRSMFHFLVHRTLRLAHFKHFHSLVHQSA